MWDRATAVLAGVLLAVNPVSVMFAQEARAHALSALLNGLALLLFVMSSHHSSTTRAPSWKWLPAFIVAVMATVLVHYASLLFVAACFAAAGLRLVGTRPFPIREMAVWSLAGIITFLGLWQVLILVAGLAGSNNLVWIEPLSAKGVAAFFLDLTVPLSRTPPLLAVAWGSLAALLLIVVLGLPRLRLKREQLDPLVIIPGIYCGLLIAVSWVRPMLLPRVATWLLIPFCLVLARAASVQPARWRRNAACSVPLLIFGFCLMHYYWYNSKEDWRKAARLASTKPRCTGPVLVSEFNALGLLYYKVEGDRPIYVFLPDPRRRNSVEFNLTQRLMQLPEIPTDAVAGFAEMHPGAVVIMRSEYAEIIPENLRTVLAQASFRTRLGGDLMVACL